SPFCPSAEPLVAVAVEEPRKAPLDGSAEKGDLERRQVLPGVLRQPEPDARQRPNPLRSAALLGCAADPEMNLCAGPRAHILRPEVSAREWYARLAECLNLQPIIG